MIDLRGFRSNVGFIIVNELYQVFWAQCAERNIWQFPQGGINPHETPEEAMYRELHEEVGLTPNQVKVLACTKYWLSYRLPERLVRYDIQPVCIGQKQKWFLLKLCDSDNAIKLNNNAEPEFTNWQWVSYWYPIGKVVSFKREVYRQALKELSLSLI